MSARLTREQVELALLEFRFRSGNTSMLKRANFHRTIMAHDAALRARVEKLEEALQAIYDHVEHTDDFNINYKDIAKTAQAALDTREEGR